LNLTPLTLPFLAAFLALSLFIKEDFALHSREGFRQVLPTKQFETERQFGEVHQTTILIFGLAFFMNLLLKTFSVRNDQKQRFKYYASACTLTVPAFVLSAIRNWFLSDGISVFPEVFDISVFVLFDLAMEYGHLSAAAIEEEYYLPAFSLEDGQNDEDDSDDEPDEPDEELHTAD
jgi:hypothetical protein